MQKLLIDGHNLIGQTPGLSLADPNDEQKLVVMLRQYAARKNARIVVVFDSGNPGGKSKELSGGNVTAIFAGSHTIADRILMERIRELKQLGRLDRGVIRSGSAASRAAAQDERVELGRVRPKNGPAAAARDRAAERRKTAA